MFKGLRKKWCEVMRNITTFEGVAIGALAILIALMFLRPGVKREDLAMYLGTGFLLEIFPTIIFGFIITAVHYGFFNSPAVLSLAPGDPNFPPYVFGMELFLNGIFSLVSMVIGAFVIGKSMGVGFISSVSLGYYAYWLALQ